MGSTRREFVKLMAGAAAVPGLPRLAAETGQAGSEGTGNATDLEFHSAMFRVQMAADQPGFIALAVDSLGEHKVDGNMMLPLAKSTVRYKVSRENRTINYSLAEAEDSPVWTFEFNDQGFTIRSTYSPKLPPSRWFLASQSTAMRRCSACSRITAPCVCQRCCISHTKGPYVSQQPQTEFPRLRCFSFRRQVHQGFVSSSQRGTKTNRIPFRSRRYLSRVPARRASRPIPDTMDTAGIS